MELICDQTVAAAYTSPAQRARVISECWFERSGYCLACESERLIRTPANTVATDFTCGDCGHRYELKTFNRRPNKSLVDGAYASLMERVRSGTAPTLCLLERSDLWHIQSMTAIHSSFLTPWVIEQRRPLAHSARRAGWIGCNIRLDRIPIDGEITVIGAGVARPKSSVRSKFRRFLPLAKLSAAQRGWTTLTLCVIRRLGKPTFSLGEVYLREHEFSAAYPKNQHLHAKIRQQLQCLRDLGVLAFEGKGKYRLLV